MITNTRIGGQPGVELIRGLRHQLPWLPILYLANRRRSTPELERRLPKNVTILREPFTAEELRGAVGRLLNVTD